MAQAVGMEKALIEGGSKIASEAIGNIRTVASLREFFMSSSQILELIILRNLSKGQEPHMIERFVAEMDKIECVIRKKIIWRGFVQSVAQAIPFFTSAATFSYGGLMVANDEIHFTSVIKYVATSSNPFSTCIIPNAFLSQNYGSNSNGFNNASS